MNVTEKKETVKILENIANQKRRELVNRRDAEKERLREAKMLEVKPLMDQLKKLREEDGQITEVHNEQVRRMQQEFQTQSKVREKAQEVIEDQIVAAGLRKPYYRGDTWSYYPDDPIEFAQKEQELDNLVDQTRIAIWGSDSVILSEVIEKLKEI